METPIEKEKMNENEVHEARYIGVHHFEKRRTTKGEAKEKEARG